MIRQQSVGWTTLALITLVGTFAQGQDEGAAELYGRGVHAYFANEYEAAAALLSESIEKFDADPRAYFFRGLALANQSGSAAGMADFMQGADVEVNRADRPVYDINGALQRVQGSLRLELEKVRAAARKSAVARQRKRDQVRYEELKRREDIVLFVPNRRPMPAVQLDVPLPDTGTSGDPFASGVAFSGGKQVDYVAPAPVEGAVAPAEDGQPRDPFASAGADTDAKTPAEAADPFATPTKKPAPTGPAATQAQAAPADANPFGENMPKLELEGADAPAGPAANRGAGLIDLLGKTLSGQTADRDPFGGPAAEAPAQGSAPDKKAEVPPATDAPVADPFAVPAKQEPAQGAEPGKKVDAPPAEAPAANPAQTPADDGPAKDSQPDKKADVPPAGQAPAADPFDEPAPKEDATKKPADKDEDPFK